MARAKKVEKVKKKDVSNIDFSLIAKDIIKTPVQDFVEESYLPYAHYVIMSRALISEDGLKPVQRRILYTMLELGLTDKNKFIKAARIVGDTMGKYHPHGDSSIGDALARMGQTFSLRVPLVGVQGSVGFTTGDDAAAPRYWEGRPTSAAMQLLSELKEGAVPMGLNYDGEHPEPAILPIKWPVGLINGSQGIAVGYSSFIPSHNPTETMDAAIALVKNPDLTISQIMKYIKGPDMPTGGILVGLDGVKEYFETGKGTFSIRGRYEIIPGNRGTHEIVFNEAPYQISAEQIKQSINDNKKDKDRFKEISEVKELSDIQNGFQLSVKVKAGANPEVVLRDLFKYTPLESKFSANLTVLKDGVPALVSIKEMLEIFVDFRKYCLVNKANFKLNSLNKAIQRLEGIIKVLVDIDKAIAIIRKAENSDTASKNLQEIFKITEEQAGHILSMPLRRLTKADSVTINEEKEKLVKEKEYYTSVLNDEEVFKAHIIKELEETKKEIGDARRTTILNITEEDLKAEAAEIKKAVAKETKNAEFFITLYSDGMITRTSELPMDKARQVKQVVKAKSQDTLLFVSRDGLATKVPVLYVSEGVEVDVEITTGVSFKDLAGISKEEIDEQEVGTLLITTTGGVNIVNGKLPNSTQFEIIKLEEEEEVLLAETLSQKDFDKKDVIIISSDGFTLRFASNQIRTSRAGAGTIKGMNINPGARAVGAAVTAESGVIVSCSDKTIKKTDLSEIPSKNRSAKGLTLHKLKDDEVVNAFVGENVTASKSGKKIILPEVSARATTGTVRPGYGVVLGAIIS